MNKWNTIRSIYIYYLAEDADWLLALRKGCLYPKKNSSILFYWHVVTNGDFWETNVQDDNDSQCLILFSPSFFSAYKNEIKDLLDSKHSVLLVYKEEDLNCNEEYKRFVQFNTEELAQGSLSSANYLEERKLGTYVLSLNIQANDQETIKQHIRKEKWEEKRLQERKEHPFRSRVPSYFILIAYSAVGIYIIPLIVWFAAKDRQPYSNIKELFTVSHFGFALCLAMIIGLAIKNYWDEKEVKNAKNEQQLFLQELNNSLAKPYKAPNSSTDDNIEPEPNSPSDIQPGEVYYPIGHLRLNWNEIKVYYQISKDQASKSFKLACRSCMIGFAMIIFVLICPFIPQYSSVVKDSLIPLIGGIGGVITEIFAGTTFIVYNKALSQMNLYHKALSHYQTYLSCVNLIDKVPSPEKRTELYEKIIVKEMDFAVNFHGEDEDSEENKPPKVQAEKQNDNG